jgi:hypothetical protein
MSKFKIKSTLVAATVALSCLAPASSVAQAPKVATSVGLGMAIAAQGNAALVAIRAEMLAAIRSSKPVLPAPRPRKVSAPAAAPAGAGSIAATAACAE